MSGRGGKPLRLLRISLAVCLIGISLWALLLPPLFPYSTHAIVNTKVVTIRAFDEGVVDQLPPVRTRLLNPGDSVGRVTRDMGKVRRELADKQLRQSKLREQLDSLDRAISGRQAKLQAEKNELVLANAGALRALELGHKAAGDKARIYRDELIEKRTRQAQVEPLFKDGIVTSSQWSETRQQTLDAEKNLTQAEADLAAYEARVEAAKRGGGGLGSEAVESALNRIAAYEREMSELSIQRVELAAGLVEIDRQIELVRSYGDADQAYELTTPIKGVVWRRQAVSGEMISEGQAVVDMADVGALFVEAYFSRDFINSIAIGDRASVYLMSASRYVQGSVVDIQMQERSGNDSNVINTMAQDSSMLRVQIELESGALEADSIGQLAKVLTSDGNTGWFGRALIWLSLVLRSHH